MHINSFQSIILLTIFAILFMFLRQGTVLCLDTLLLVFVLKRQKTVPVSLRLHSVNIIQPFVANVKKNSAPQNEVRSKLFGFQFRK